MAVAEAADLEGSTIASEVLPSDACAEADEKRHPETYKVQTIANRRVRRRTKTVNVQGLAPTGYDPFMRIV